MRTHWPDADLRRLPILWAQGLSAAKIAIAMGGRYSKNAIIGKVHRLGLPARRVGRIPCVAQGTEPPKRARSCSNYDNIEAITREVQITERKPPTPNKPDEPKKRKHTFIPLPPSADTVVTKRAIHNGAGLSMRDIKWVDPDKAAIVLDPDEIPIEQRKSFFDLQQQHCRFPYGDVGAPDFFYCGGERVDPCYPYCPMHCRVAYAGSGTKSVYAFGRRG